MKIEKHFKLDKMSLIPEIKITDSKILVDPDKEVLSETYDKAIHQNITDSQLIDILDYCFTIYNIPTEELRNEIDVNFNFSPCEIDEYYEPSKDNNINKLSTYKNIKKLSRYISDNNRLCINIKAV